VGVLALAARAASISGIAISQNAPGNINGRACKTSLGWNYGRISRFDVRNGNVSDEKVIWEEYNAHCPRISPSGTRVAFNTSNFSTNCRRPAPDNGCKSTLYLINSDGSGEARVLDPDVNCLTWLDWPVEEYVYYQKDYEGSELWRVNTSGTPKPELVGSNFRGKDKAPPDGARYWSMTSDAKKVGGFFGGGLNYGIINDDKSITWDQMWGGCGGSISPDGNYLTRNSGGHSGIFIHLPEGGIWSASGKVYAGREAKNAPAATTVSDCRNGGSNWHRMHWPVNSSEWMLVSMGNGYQIEKSSHPVLLKMDGSDCFQILPNKNGVFYEGSDFWFGDPDKPGGSVYASMVRSETAARGVAISRKNGSVIVRSARDRIRGISLYGVDGRHLADGVPSDAHVASIPLSHTGAGLYVVRVQMESGVAVRSVVRSE
jgi:hypothetical protein